MSWDSCYWSSPQIPLLWLVPSNHVVRYLYSDWFLLFTWSVAQTGRVIAVLRWFSDRAEVNLACYLFYKILKLEEFLFERYSWDNSRISSIARYCSTTIDFASFVNTFAILCWLLTNSICGLMDKLRSVHLATSLISLFSFFFSWTYGQADSIIYRVVISNIIKNAGSWSQGSL